MLGWDWASPRLPTSLPAMVSHPLPESRRFQVEQKVSISRPKQSGLFFFSWPVHPAKLICSITSPILHKLFKTELPKSVSMGQRVTAMTKGKAQLVAPSKFKFSQQGESGIWMSELLPHLAGQADELCFIRSMNTNAINHDPGKTSFCTGSEIPGKPSMGAWLSYGIGTMNKDLPDYVVLPSAFWSGKVNVQALYSRLWGSGFLPSKHQGTSFQAVGDPVLFLSNPAGVDPEHPTPNARFIERTQSKSIILKSAIRRSRRRSLSRKWRFECRRRSPN